MNLNQERVRTRCREIEESLERLERIRGTPKGMGNASPLLQSHCSPLARSSITRAKCDKIRIIAMRTVILLLIYALLTIFLFLLLLLFWPFGVRDPLLRIAKWAMSLGCRILGLKVEVSGRERLDRRAPYVFMANHLSFLDGPLLFWLIPRPIRVILKKEVFRIPIIGVGMKYVGFIPVDRKKMWGGKRSIDKAIQLMRRRRYSFLIFPEGTRSRDGRLQAFKRGGFFLALESRTPIVPVTIRGTYELMPRGRFSTRRGLIHVLFHPPIPVEGYDQSNMSVLIERVKAAIESGLRN